MQSSVAVARQMQLEIDDIDSSQTARRARTNQVIDPIFVANSRGYVRAIVNEINGTYENRWYDACAILLRRLVEMLIFEVYRDKGRLQELEDPTHADGYMRLSDLISKISSDSHLDLKDKSKRALRILRDIGNEFAHGRRLRARKSDIEPNLRVIRIMVEDLVSFTDASS